MAQTCERNPSHRRKWLVLLSGTSCSGKTTVGRALQRRISSQSRPFLHIEADQFLPHLPQTWSHEDKGVCLSRALHRAIVAFVEEGFDLIVDGVLPYGRPEGIADALTVFGRYQLCYVGVHCALEVLEERERRRPDRKSEWARQQYMDLHVGAVYDLEIDTTATSAEENAERIRQHLITRDSSLIISNDTSHAAS